MKRAISKTILSTKNRALFTLLAIALFVFSSHAAASDDPSELKLQKGYRMDYVQGDVLTMFKEGRDPQAVLEKSEVEFTGFDRVHSIDPVVEKAKKEYKLSGKKGGWYWFKGEKYEAIESASKEEIFLNAYSKMTPEEKALYQIYKVTLPETGSVEEAVAALDKSPDTEYAEPNYVSEICFSPNTDWNIAYEEQWAHQMPSIEDAWDTERGSSEVIIAVIDTGVDVTHLNLAPNIWHHPSSGDPGRDFVEINLEAYEDEGCEQMPGEDYTLRDNDPSDFNGHGTHVAGIAAACEASDVGYIVGVIGVAHRCQIMPIRAGFSILVPVEGGEPGQTSEGGLLENDDIVAALKYAIDNGASVLNMSFSDTYPSRTIRRAIDYAISMNVVPVAAAGNDNEDVRNYPAAYDDVIAVASTNSSDAKSSFSNYGDWVNVAAPGGENEDGGRILSTFPFIDRYEDYNGFAEWHGTSMACPYVAGLAALLKSEYPYATVDEIATAIYNGADDIGWPEGGAGRVNCNNSFTSGGIPNIIARAYVSDPEDDEVARNWILRIKGVAWSDDFSHYTVEVKENGTPDPWVTTGMTLTDGGTQSAGGGILATWDTSLFPAGEYAFKLTVFDIFAASVEDIVIADITAYKYGNVDGSGSITEEDLSLASERSVVSIALTPDQMGAADVDGDGVVTAEDVALISQYIAGTITLFPEEEWR